MASAFTFTDPVAEARHRGPGPWPHLLLAAIAGLLIAGGLWASWATIEEVTRGEGRVIPSRQIQVVQTLDPGIVEDILVSEGDLVEEGQMLLRIDDTGAASDLGELTARRRALRAQIARLEAEMAGADEIDFPEDLLAEAPEVAESERSLFQTRRESLQSELSVLRRQAEQREQELEELRSAEEQQAESLELARQELAVYNNMSPGVVPQVDLLRVRREVSELTGELEATRRAQPRVQSAIREAYERIEDRFLAFRSQAQEALNQRRADLAVVREAIRAAADRVTRTGVRSPVEGVVNRVNVNTLGGVVQPGEDLVEIVPLEDSLLVEARIRPADIAFIRPGLPATVRITAYDYTVYGALDGTVERVGADTVVDEVTGERFYRIVIRTEQTDLDGTDEALPIIPGMVASIDVLTGEKTVLDYLLNPLTRAGAEALRER
jgi:adhesin transport system membrane fusion protein